MDLIGRLKQGWHPPSPPDPESLRFEMTQTDPDFAHVRRVQHDALNLIGASKAAAQMRDRFNEQWRDSWRTRP